MQKYKVELYLNSRSNIPVHSKVMYFTDDEVAKNELKKTISIKYFLKLENILTGNVFSNYIEPESNNGRTLGYLPALRTTGKSRSAAFYIIGVKPLNFFPYKTSPVWGHFPEYGKNSLESKFPETRAFPSNKKLALKYYKKCLTILNKKNSLVNLGEDLFYKIHNSRQLVEDIFEIYTEINNKNNNHKLIF